MIDDSFPASVISPEDVLACPECRGSVRMEGDVFECVACGSKCRRESGVWRPRVTAGEAQCTSFVDAYRVVRESEGWGSEQASYYRQLPKVPPTDPQWNIWRLRARTFQAFVDQVLIPMEAATGAPLTVVDAGAGNCWLSHKMAQRGHRVIAVDIRTDPRDGLEASVHYNSSFTAVQTSFDRLPLGDDTADGVVFNASLHYSPDVRRTLIEALRVLRVDGRIILLDSPIYRCADSGRRMAAERRKKHEARYQDEIEESIPPGEGYLTRRQLNDIANDLSLNWRRIAPGFGLRWTLQRWKTRLLKGREAARMPVLAARRVSGDSLSFPSVHERHSWIVQKLGYFWHWLQAVLFLKHRYDTFALEEIRGYRVHVLPKVFNPALFNSSQWLVELMEEGCITVGSNVLDMGTGAGLTAVAAAARGSDVVAVDINPAAVRSARINALLNEVEKRIDVRKGDLFEPVDGERFDTVFFNPPFYEGMPADVLDHAWRGVDIGRRFARELKGYLRPVGKAYIVLSSRGAPENFLRAVRGNDLEIQLVRTYDLISETQAVYCLTSRR